MVEFFHICDIDKCLNYLKRDENDDLAVGGSRQHILNCPEYTPSKIYCFKYRDNVANYQPSLLIRKGFHLKSRIDQIVRRLFEAGIFEKWAQDCKRRRKYEIPYIAPIEMQLIHIYFPLIFLMLLAPMVSISTFIAELITANQMKKENNFRIWEYFEQFFSGHRYYFLDWPRRLQENHKSGTK